ncbi:TPA: hypothetical protein DEG21_06170 [Patescibacteria group bacterium]|nr:hypothetical protein [Candidatus Gracilibacteria bacterium]
MILNLSSLKDKKSSLTHLIKSVISTKEKQKEVLNGLKRRERILEQKSPLIEEVEDRYDILDLKDIKEKRVEEKKIPRHKAKNNNETFQKLKKDRDIKRTEEKRKKEEKRQENIRKKEQAKIRRLEKKKLDDEKREQFLKEELPVIKAKEAITIEAKRIAKKT